MTSIKSVPFDTKEITDTIAGVKEDCNDVCCARGYNLCVKLYSNKN